MTKSEELFENFLQENNLKFEKVKEADTPRPDYLVCINDVKLAFEVKELEEDENFKTGINATSSRIIGDHIRSKIGHARRQIKWATKQGIPTILLIYNNLDPIQFFGTEDQDFIHAMYGADTLLISQETGDVIDRFCGEGKSFQKNKNTSFSALGRLRQYGTKEKQIVTKFTLFKNVHAEIKIPYDKLPKCFEVLDFAFE